MYDPGDDEESPNFGFPIFLLLKFIFIAGWLSVAETIRSHSGFTVFLLENLTGHFRILLVLSLSVSKSIQIKKIQNCAKYMCFDVSFVIVFIVYLKKYNGLGIINTCLTNKSTDRMQNYWFVKKIQHI